MRCLGRLTNLRCIVQRSRSKDITFDLVTRKWRDMGGMEWSLASGLVHLHGFVNLRTFHILGYLREWIGVPEMMFIKQHWHNLKEMECNDVGEIVQKWMATEWF